jgi:hypothetical protein
MIIDGTNGLTFNNGTTQASAGQVLQVVNATYTTGTSTTSTTLTATGLTATITPKFSTSKILCLVNVNGIQKNAGDVNNGVILSLYRSTTALKRFSDYAGYTASSVINNVAGSGLTYLDSPATTSATTYNIYFATNSSGFVAYINAGNENSSITLMEIAG